MKKILFSTLLCLFTFFNLLGSQAQVSSSKMTETQELRRQIEALKQSISQLQTKVETQEKRIQELEGETLSAGTTAPGTPQLSSESWTGGFKQGLQAFNPEIGVVADVTAAVSESAEDAEGNDKISVREIELVLGHDIDPYGRFDSTITFSDFEDVGIEEAYITFFTLPFDLRGRVGRMRPKIGKASASHRDALDTVDEPLVVQNFLGVEGLSRTGLELSYFLPVPWEVLTHELTAGVMEGGIGEEGTLFGETRRIPSYYAHLKNFWDISDVTHFELGGTYLLGSSDADSKYEVNALGLDATLIHYFDPIHRLKWQTEFYFQDRDEAFVASADEHVEEESEEEDVLLSDFEDQPWGLYTVMDYRLSSQWSLGGRFDYVIPTGIDLDSPEEADIAESAYLTFHQSEFTRWRLQYQHVEFADGSDDNRVFLQGTVAIGVHKHQLQ